ncbi:MAG: fused MFS/spermidine synthase [Coriobacteriia bacterium]|nr:fused MFS/spermidine synthase [Coriobacteriia bacterium]
MSEPSDIHVIERGAIRTLRIGRIEQSSMYLDSPFETDFDYPAYLHITVAIVPEPRRALVIGLGGGTVVKQLWRDHRALSIDSVELEPRVADLARTQFALPTDERIRVHIGDGRAFVEDTSETYDIVIVDAFDDDTVPLPLRTEQFVRLAHARLAEGGVLAYNMHGSVVGDRSKPFRALHRTLSNTFRRVWTFPVGLSGGAAAGVHREIIVLASDAALTDKALLARIESRVDGRVGVLGFERTAADLYREGVRSGDVAVLTDPPG